MTWYWWLCISLYALGVAGTGIAALGSATLSHAFGAGATARDRALLALAALFWPATLIV